MKNCKMGIDIQANMTIIVNVNKRCTTAEHNKMEVETMSYKEARAAAESCKTFEEVDRLLKLIECEFETISDRQYYTVKHVAIDAVTKNS